MWSCKKCGWWKLQSKATSDYCKRCGEKCAPALWDCTIRLLSKMRNGQYYFPMGLLESVREILKPIGVELRVSGWPSAPHNSTLLDDITWIGYDLRSHQDEAVVKALPRLWDGLGTILMMPTGSGKSLLAMYLINELRVKTLILVHKKNLMEQWQNGIQKTLDYEPGIYGDGIKEIKPITIGMVQTIAKDKRFDINYFDFIVVDEVHHLPADQTYDIVMKSNAYYKLGLSATPTREDGNEMKMFAAMGPIVKVATIKELIQSGVLAKPKIEYMNAPPGPGGNTYAMMYKNNITMNTMRNQMIAQKAQSLEKKGLSVLITVNQIRHGKTLEAMIAGSKFVHGQTPKEERHKAMEEFENGDLRVMISTLLNEGSDIPCLDAILLASGGKSESAQIQKIGRALRTTDTKKHALIIDVLDQGKWLRDHAQQRIKLYSEVFG